MVIGECRIPKLDASKGTIAARRPSNSSESNKPASRYTARVARAVVYPSGNGAVERLEKDERGGG